ncbi:MAG: hypothetical protein M1836_004465 [Candelina mexicana]|nr:MAG: hypothetical protein M1836_004465 [Candelina mexicana]
MPNPTQNLARQAESAAQDAFLADRALVPQTIFDSFIEGLRGHRVVRMATAAITSLNGTIATLSTTVANLTTTVTNVRNLNANLLNEVKKARAATSAVRMGLQYVSMYIPKAYKFLYNCDDVAYPNGNQYVQAGFIDGTYPLASEVATNVPHVPVEKRGKGYGFHLAMRDAKAMGEYVEDLRGAKNNLVKQLESVLPSLKGEKKKTTEKLLADVAAKFDVEEEHMASEAYKIANLSDHESDDDDDDEEMATGKGATA